MRAVALSLCSALYAVACGPTQSSAEPRAVSATTASAKTATAAAPATPATPTTPATTSAVAAATSGEHTFVGAETCAACHTQAYAWWKTSHHGNAGEPLVRRGRQRDPKCVTCHVTGPDDAPGTLDGIGRHEGVGCESCHGAGAEHVNDPTTTRDNVARAVPAERCLACHEADHADEFDYDSRRAKLLSAAHGAASRHEVGR